METLVFSVPQNLPVAAIRLFNHDVDSTRLTLKVS